MKLFVYGCRPYDEADIFTALAQKTGLEIGTTVSQPTPENAVLARGYDAVSIVSTPMTGENIRYLQENGVRLISTRTIGYDHVDLAAARECGMQVANAAYSPECVADYTIMLMLMALRRMKRILQRADIHDFSLPGSIGRELHSCTVGVIGTGRIGRTVIRDLSGFGCRVLSCNRSGTAVPGAETVALDVLLRESDIVSLHLPLTEATRNLLSAEKLALMKPDAILVNTARGALVDTEAMIRALETGRLGGAALDVIEHEAGLFHFDCKATPLPDRTLSILKDMPNVIFSPHMAFYTREAVEEMAMASVRSCLCLASGEADPHRIV